MWCSQLYYSHRPRHHRCPLTQEDWIQFWLVNQVRMDPPLREYYIIKKTQLLKNIFTCFTISRNWFHKYPTFVAYWITLKSAKERSVDTFLDTSTKKIVQLLGYCLQLYEVWQYREQFLEALNRALHSRYFIATQKRWLQVRWGNLTPKRE